MTLTQQLTDYVRACFTGIWIETSEQSEAITEIARLCHAQDWHCQTWDIEQGVQPSPTGTSEGQADPLAPLTGITGDGERPQLVLLVNYHRFLGSPEVVQTLHRRIIAGRQERTVYIVISPGVQLPPELDKLFTVIGHELPNRDQLAEIASGVATEPGELPEGAEHDQLIEAAAGLTRLEAENAFSLSLVREGQLRPETIWQRKLESLNRAGLLTVSRGGGSFQDLGGLRFACANRENRRTAPPGRRSSTRISTSGINGKVGRDPATASGKHANSPRSPEPVPAADGPRRPSTATAARSNSLSASPIPSNYGSICSDSSSSIGTWEIRTTANARASLTINAAIERERRRSGKPKAWRHGGPSVPAARLWVTFQTGTTRRI